MKKLLKLMFLFTASVSLMACNGENFENLSKAANEIGMLYGTRDVNVGTSFIRSTGSANTDAYTIKISNIKEVDEGNYAKLFVASNSAKIVYDNLTPEQRKEHNMIKVTVASRLGDENFDYTMDELKKVGGFLKIAGACITKVKDKKYDELYTYFDQKAIAHDVFTNELVNKAFIPNETVWGTIDNLKPQGFEFGIKDGKKVIKTYTAVTVKDGASFLFTITCVNDKSQKVTGFWING